MSRLDCLDDALIALAAFLDAHGHGAACVCGPCTAYAQALALLPRLDHLVRVLKAWSHLVAGEHDIITAEDLALALRLLDD